jgi:beta-lactamase class D
MKNHILFVIACALIACNGKEKIENQTSKTTDNFVLNQEFQQLFDSEKLNGAVLVYDLQKDTFYSNNFEWCMKGHLPASTFKIANSIIALETGVVENDSTLFKWDGQKRAINNWEQDLILKDAFHFSCVPCYQEVARNIGTERMIEYLDKLGYGDMKVDSSNIDYFWLEGKSQIFQFQQVDFLKRFYLSKLPISGRTEKIMKRMMVIEENENYKLTGKTGWSDSYGNNCWFVGYVETKKGIYFYATNIEPTEGFDMGKFSGIREEITVKALKIQNVLK